MTAKRGGGRKARKSGRLRPKPSSLGAAKLPPGVSKAEELGTAEWVGASELPILAAVRYALRQALELEAGESAKRLEEIERSVQRRLEAVLESGSSKEAIEIGALVSDMRRARTQSEAQRLIYSGKIIESLAQVEIARLQMEALNPPEQPGERAKFEEDVLRRIAGELGAASDIHPQADVPADAGPRPRPPATR